MRRSNTRQRNEHGAGALEFMLVMSVLIAIFMLTLAYAVKAQTRRVVTAAAERGLSTTARYDGTAAQGETAARQLLRDMDDDVDVRSVNATRGATRATMTIVATAPDFFPLLPMTVRVTVRGPVERFVE